MIVDEFTGKQCCVKQKTENREHVANPPSAWAGNKDITELICRRMLLFNVISNKPFIKFIAAPDTHSCVPAYKFSQNRLFHNFWKLYTPDYSKLQEMEDVGGKLTGFLRPWWTRNDIFNIWNRMGVPSSKQLWTSPFKLWCGSRKTQITRKAEKYAVCK